MQGVNRVLPALRTAIVVLALLAPAVGHMALALGHGYGAATALAAVQAIALGVGAGSLLGAGRRWLAVLLACLLLAALALGELAGPGGGLLAAPGLSHAMLYAGLLIVFGASLRPGRTSLVTGIAARLNPSFHPGMVPYTRKVTWAWCLFFAAQLGLSAGLLAFGWTQAWLLLVGALHLPTAACLALAEYTVRHWRFRHEQYTSLRDTIRGVRMHGRL